jgi:hypothetical protein
MFTLLLNWQWLYLLTSEQKAATYIWVTWENNPKGQLNDWMLKDFLNMVGRKTDKVKSLFCEERNQWYFEWTEGTDGDEPHTHRLYMDHHTATPIAEVLTDINGREVTSSFKVEKDVYRRIFDDMDDYFDRWVSFDGEELQQQYFMGSTTNYFFNESSKVFPHREDEHDDEEGGRLISSTNNTLTKTGFLAKAHTQVFNDKHEVEFEHETKYTNSFGRDGSMEFIMQWTDCYEEWDLWIDRR